MQPISHAVAQTSVWSTSPNESADRFRSLFASWFRRKPPIPDSSGGSRGQFCLLLPPGATFVEGASELWSQRPSFIWVGRMEKILVKEVGVNDPLWQQAIPLDTTAENALALQALRYSGPALEAGKRYEWQAFERSFDSSAQQLQSFAILPSGQRGPTTRAWIQEQATLVQAEATGEEQALRQVAFLLDQGLSADFYQALFLAKIRGQLDEEGELMVAEVLNQQCLGK